jgi:hypothetical protein
LRHSSFQPGEYWTDTDGKIIDAHGAGLLSHAGKVFWYGTKRSGHPQTAPPGKYPKYSAYCYPPAPDRPGGERVGARLGDGFTEGVNLYVSDGDLYNWQHAGLVFAANKTGAHCLERPKVIRCPGTGKFVLWAKGFTPAESAFNGTKVAVIATADTPLGPFELVDPAEPFYAPGGAGGQMADATLHVDRNGEAAWLYWRGVSPSAGKGFFVGRLSSDCTRLEGQPRLLASIQHEAPAVFEAPCAGQGSSCVFIWTSSTTGFAANPAHLVSSAIWPAHHPYGTAVMY